MTDLLIIGGGMAGLTAALYAKRAGKTVLLVEKETLGGQITSSPLVENYPGVASVSGNQLTDGLLNQVMDLGAEVDLEEITALTKENGIFVATAGSARYEAKSVIIASGARPRRLGLPEEEALIGHGVSFCALCDGAFYKGMDVAVVGGGNSAAQAAVYLADICRTVTVIQQFDHLTCDKRDEKKLRTKDNIRLCLGAEITSLNGNGELTGVTVQQNGEGRCIPLSGLFVCIGRVADNEPFASLLQLDGNGCIVAGEDCRTSVDGLFAAGDCRTKAIRQLTTAAADGSVSAVAACAYIDNQE